MSRVREVDGAPLGREVALVGGHDERHERPARGRTALPLADARRVLVDCGEHLLAQTARALERVAALDTEHHEEEVACESESGSYAFHP